VKPDRSILEEELHNYYYWIKAMLEEDGYQFNLEKEKRFFLVM